MTISENDRKTARKARRWYRENKERAKENQRKRLRANPDLVKQNNRKAHEKLSAWLQTLKEVPCLDCGQRYHTACMEFHHVEEKKLTIGQLRGGRRRIEEELKKCVVLCANCHRLCEWEKRNRGPK